MPRSRFDKLAAPKRDPIKATILERKDATDTSLEAMAAARGVSVATRSRMLAKHTDAWPLGQIKRLYRFFKLDAADLREDIRA